MDVIGCLMMRPPIPQPTFQAFLYYIMGPLLFKDKHFTAFLGDPWGIIWKVYIRLLSFTQHQPLWAFSPLFP